MKARIVPGYIHGFTQPAIAFEVQADIFEEADSLGPRLWSVLQIRRPNSTFFDAIMERALKPETQAAAGATSMALCTLRLLDGAGLPLSDPPVIKERPENKTVEAAIPVYDPEVALDLIRWIFQVVQLLKDDKATSRIPGAQLATFTWHLNRLDHAAPPGANGIRMMRAAHSAGIPYLALSDGVHQYGLGARGRWFLGTVTDETPGLSRTLCSDKQKTKEVLSKAGIPVPSGALVSSAAQAMQVAERLGYPVVIKPADRERGEAVAANLKTPKAVAKAFKDVAGISNRVLLEKHLPGEVYRAHVYRGEIWVLSGRTPAGVTGDGTHDVATLVKQENERRKVERTLVAQLNPIKMDAEALALLGDIGMDPSSVPEAGQFVALKAAANASTGGRLFPFEGDLHPETEKMLLRTAAVLKIDLTAIDFVTTDITKPWYETQTAIIEANSGPQLSMLYPEYDRKLLETYVVNRGRIPTALLLTGSAEVQERIIQMVRADTDWAIGVASVRGTYLGDEVIMGPSEDLCAATRSLVVNPGCEAILMISDGAEILSQGLPLDRIDTLALAGWPPDSEHAREVVERIRPHLEGQTLVMSGQEREWTQFAEDIETRPTHTELLSALFSRLQSNEASSTPT